MPSATLSSSGPPGLVTSTAIRTQVDAILGWSTPIALFPVRHHSPTCARHLAAFLEAYRPQHVLIEGPSRFNDRIGALADPDHVAPFAIVAAPDGDGTGSAPSVRSYYPLCDYSPELVALRVARTLGAEARFIDLVFGERATDERADVVGDVEPDPSTEATLANPGGPRAEPSTADRLGSTDDDLAGTRFTRAIVKRFGCRDFDEVWEAFFEQAGWNETPERWAQSVATYALLARRSATDRQLHRDGTLSRERHMARHIAEVRAKAGPDARIVVITGAFHSVALRETEPEPPTRRKAVPIDIYLAAYTFPRLDALLGYASGMSGPQFYQHVWEARDTADPFARAAERVLVEASRMARQDGETLGTADAIAALAFAHRLAEFRGRPRIGRMELIEAARTCFVKGDHTLVGTRVERAIHEVMRGGRVGRLGASAGQPALITAFHQTLKELRLTLEHGRPQALALPLFESELALERSRFLHRCRLLEVPIGRWERGPDLRRGEDLHLTVEHWSLQYGPEVEPRLAELAHLGSAVADVAAAVLVQRVLTAPGKSEELAALLLEGLVMGLHREANRLVPRLGATMFADDDVVSLLTTGRMLRSVLRGRERLGAAMVGGLPQLARQAYLQGTLRLERLASIAADPAKARGMDRILEALASLLDVALTDADLAPPRAFLSEHAYAARHAARGKAPVVLGALDAFLLQLGEATPQDLSRNFAAGRTKPDAVGGYLEGVLAVAQSALLSGTSLLDELLAFVSETEWTTFLSSLPSLRRALTRLSPRDTEAVADLAARKLGLARADAIALFSAPPEVVARLGAYEAEWSAAQQAWAGEAQLRLEQVSVTPDPNRGDLP